MAILLHEEVDMRAAADTHSPQPIVENKTLARWKIEYSEAMQELEKASGSGNTVEIDFWESEVQKLKQHFGSATNNRGQSRDLNNPQDLMRPKIHGALKRAYKKLLDATPSMGQLAEHFKLNISSVSGCFVYHPSGDPIKWAFDPKSE